jgi:peptidoglycan/LPS O-acetylase OafA/YrhL
VLWSLAVEEHFYLVFPPLLILLLRRMQRRAIASTLFALCISVLVWRVILVHGEYVSSSHIFYSTDTRFDSLLFGCVMGLWRNPVLDVKVPAGACSSPTGGEQAILAAALLLLAFSLFYADPGFHKTLRYTVQGIALFPIFWLAMRYPSWLTFRWLNWSPVRWFGGISYSFYLAHPFWLGVAHQMASGLTGAVLGFVMTTLFSTLLYWHLERPFMQMGRALQNDAWRWRFKEPT